MRVNFRNIKILFCLLIYVSISITKLFSQNQSFVFNELPLGDISPRVNEVTQDRNGYLWLATPKGLIKYDGYSFFKYENNLDTNNYFDSNLIARVQYYEATNSLLLQTLGGVFIYNIDANKYLRIELEKNIPNIVYSENKISDLTLDTKGNLWIIYNGNLYVLKSILNNIQPLTIYGYNKNTESQLLDNPTTFLNIEKGSGNNVFVGTSNGLFHYYFNNDSVVLNNSYKPTDNFFIGAQCFNPEDDVLWVLNKNYISKYKLLEKEGIYTLTKIEGQNIEFNTPNGYEKNIAFQKDNRLWLANHNSLILIDNVFESSQSITYFEINSPLYDLNTLNFSSIFVSKENSVWFSTHGNGVLQMKYLPTIFKSVALNKIFEPKKNLDFKARCICTLPDKRILIGTQGYGVFVYDKSNNKLTKLSSSSNITGKINSCTSLLQISPTEILMKTNIGLLNYNIITEQLKYQKIEKEDGTFIESFFAQHIVRVSDNKFWMLCGKKNDLFLVEDYKVKYQISSTSKEMKVVAGLINSISYSPQYKELLISSNLGLQRIFLDNNNVPKQSVIYNINEPIANILKTNQFNVAKRLNDSIIFAGTNGQGLIRIGIGSDPEKKHLFTVQCVTEELNDPDLINVKGLAFDDKSNIWFTSKKIAYYNQVDNSILRFDGNSGVIGYGFLIDGIYENEEAYFFLNSNNVNCLYKDVDFGKDKERDILLSGLYNIGRSILQNDTIRGRVIYNKPLNELEQLNIPNDLKSFSLSFSDNDLNNLQEKEFYYKVKGLDGFDSIWTNMVGNFIHFTGLSYGNYTIQVKVKQSNGLLSKTTKTLKVYVEPPFWMKWWFLLFVAVSLTSIVLLLFRLRTKVLLKQKENLEETVKERTAELFLANEDLHVAIESRNRFLSIVGHDLKGPFATVLGFSSYLREEFDNMSEDDKHKFIDYIYEDSNKLNNLLENLLHWGKQQTSGGGNLKKESVSLKKVCNEVVEISKINNKNIKIINNTEHTHFVLGDENAINLIIRNLVWNAIKFSYQDSEIVIKSTLQTNDIKIEIVDSGVGMSQETIDNLFNFDKLFSKSGTKGEQGSGIGLINSKIMVEQMGGKMHIDSRVCKGTTMSFTLLKG